MENPPILKLIEKSKNEKAAASSLSVVKLVALACGATTEGEETAFADTEVAREKRPEDYTADYFIDFQFVTVQHMRTI